MVLFAVCWAVQLNRLQCVQRALTYTLLADCIILQLILELSDSAHPITCIMAHTCAPVCFACCLPQEYEERYTSWMHSQEEELLRLQAQNAPSSELQYHALQHNQQKKKWEQKWGAPTGQGDPGRLNRLHLLPQAAEQLKAMQGHSRAQQQQQPQQTRMAQLSAAVQQSAQQRLQQPQCKTALSSSSSSKHSRVRAASSNVLDIPDDSADVVSIAAAATASAAQLGSYSSQAASAAVIVKAVCQEPMDR